MKQHSLVCLATIALCLLAILPAQAADVKLESGDLSPLRGATAVNVRYVYDGMMVDKETEAAYVKRAAAGEEKGGSGKGAKWMKLWTESRVGRYQPKFEKELNNALKKKGITFGGNQSAAKHTLILRTVMCDPGWLGWGLIRKSSRLDAVATLVETAKPNAVLATIRVNDCGGSGTDYNLAGRVEASYANCAKELGNLLKKSL
ncbi:MAG: hypothetical protein ABIP85_15785 [Chthoniobacteraceae bacterium]